MFTGVYGPVCSRDSEDFWEELRSVKGLWSDPWCVGGDFNLVRFLEERSRGGGLTASMRRFSEVLEDRELKKLEWTVSYKKAKIGSSVGIFGGASGSRCK